MPPTSSRVAVCDSCAGGGGGRSGEGGLKRGRRSRVCRAVYSNRLGQTRTREGTTPLILVIRLSTLTLRRFWGVRDVWEGEHGGQTGPQSVDRPRQTTPKRRTHNAIDRVRHRKRYCVCRWRWGKHAPWKWEGEFRGLVGLQKLGLEFFGLFNGYECISRPRGRTRVRVSAVCSVLIVVLRVGGGAPAFVPCVVPIVLADDRRGCTGPPGTVRGHGGGCRGVPWLHLAGMTLCGQWYARGAATGAGVQECADGAADIMHPVC